MRIAIDLTSLADNFSGIERFASSISYEMLRNHNENKYILIFKHEVFPIFKEFEKCSNVEMIVLKHAKKLFFSQFILPACLRKIKADYYLFMAFPSPFFLFKKNMITTIHDIGCWDCPETMKTVSKIYFRLLYRKDAWMDKSILTVSDFSKQRIKEKLGVKSNGITTIYNGISDVFLNYCSDEKREQQVVQKYELPEKYILCLSTLEPRKNMRLLVEVYEELFLEGKLDCELVLAGRNGWKMQNLLEQVDKNVVEHIHFTGFVDNEDLPVVYKYAKCFVFPSIYEGFGIPPLEALYMNTKVVSSDAASLPEVLGDAAVYFKNRDKEDLKVKLLTCLEEPVDEEWLAVSRKVTSKYRWDKEASKLLQYLEKLK